MKLKKLLALFVCIMLCFVFGVSVNAAQSKEYALKEAGISVSIPDNMYVFTRDVASDDPKISEVGYSYDGLISKFESENIVLDAMNIDDFTEIVIVAESTSDKNYYDLTAKDFYAVIEDEKLQSQNNGRTNVEADLYEQEDADFIKIYSESSDASVEYITVYADKKINVKFINYDGEITSLQEDMVEGIIDSISFSEKKEISEEKTEPSEEKNEPSSDSESDGEKSQSDVAEESDAEYTKETPKPDEPQDEPQSDENKNSDNTLRIAVIVLGGLVVILIFVLVFGKRRRR